MTVMRKTAPGAAFALLALFASHGARAGDDVYTLTGDIGGAKLLSQPQAALFGTGASVAVGVYRPVKPTLLAGLRLRVGFFADGPPPQDKNLEDPGAASTASALLALRWRPLAVPTPGDNVHRTEGLWVELGAGGGLDGQQVRPMAELGLGWGFGFKSYVVSPMVRYHQVFQSGPGEDGNDAKILFFGVEVIRPGRGFGSHAAADLAKAAGGPPTPKAGGAGPAGADGVADGPRVSSAIPDIKRGPVLPRDTDDDGIMDADDACPGKSEDVDGFEDWDGCPDDDNDGDGILDLFDKCRDDPEVVNGIADEDGCPDKGLFQMVGDRIVLDDKVMFQTGRADLSKTGRKILDAVAALCRQHLEWEQLSVEGHTDARGSEELNQRLSEDRATGVRRGLLDLGFDDRKVSARGFGATRPRFQGDDEEAHRRNRRVELVVIKKRVPPPDAAQAAATPGQPGGPARPGIPAQPGASLAQPTTAPPAPGATAQTGGLAAQTPLVAPLPSPAPGTRAAPSPPPPTGPRATAPPAPPPGPSLAPPPVGSAPPTARPPTPVRRPTPSPTRPTRGDSLDTLDEQAQ
jgi:outer membrane protein OmpA-like peptidoglycan-associated protein